MPGAEGAEISWTRILTRMLTASIAREKYKGCARALFLRSAFRLERLPHRTGQHRSRLAQQDRVHDQIIMQHIAEDHHRVSSHDEPALAQDLQRTLDRGGGIVAREFHHKREH